MLFQCGLYLLQCLGHILRDTSKLSITACGREGEDRVRETEQVEYRVQVSAWPRSPPPVTICSLKESLISEDYECIPAQELKVGVPNVLFRCIDNAEHSCVHCLNLAVSTMLL